MRIEGAEIVRVRLPLVVPFRTSFGTDTSRETILLRLVTDVGEGWAECGSEPDPLYSEEYLDDDAWVVEHELLPRLLRLPPERLTASVLAEVFRPVKKHPMAKHLVETAVLDAELQASGMSLGVYLGAVHDRVPCGVSVGITDDLPTLLAQVEGYLADGYRRIKLKIEPGWDVEPVRAVRRLIGPDVPLQVDANTAYTLADARHLARLDEFDLLLIEQPLAEDDVRGHAELARRLRTPVCLDESITSARDAATAIALGACSIINVKPARVGGYLEARRIHDVARAHGVPVWCGGMLETGIGRAANLALAALPGFTLPGDTSASSRYYAEDLTAPWVLDDGHLSVPVQPGASLAPIPAILAKYTLSTTELPLS